MSAQKQANASLRAPLDFDYSQVYLRQYWPERPSSPEGWADNAVLMLAYQDAALALYESLGRKPFRLLDVSTGPALAPLLAMVSCVREAQLSDFHEINRLALEHMPIEYWKSYVPMLIRLYARPDTRAPEILSLLDALRSKHTPIAVDLFASDPFAGAIRPSEFDVISMNFVADGITQNEGEYLRCLGKVTDMVRPGGGFTMSAIVDSQSWQLGSREEPSPNVSEETIVHFLESQQMRIVHLSRSMRHTGLDYTGGWIVLSAVKEAS